MTKKRSKHTGHTISLLVWGTLTIAASFSIRYWYDSQHPAVLPEFAGSYQATALSLHCAAGANEQIKLVFTPSEPSLNESPRPVIVENRQTAVTTIKFGDVSKLAGQFSYDQAAKCPLIGQINNAIVNNELVVTIARQNAYVPALAKVSGSMAIITLPAGDNDFPKIERQKPGPDSTAFPALRPISFHVITAGALKELEIFVNNSAVNATTTVAAGNDYLVQFPYQVEKDKDYSIKTIAGDDQGRVSVAAWTFEGQIPSEAILGKDRFKFLGWWGRINAAGIAVREDANINSDKLGTLSSINNVKILKEVYGQALPSADGGYANNLWYQIDGGKYPGGYVFSEFITPVDQPQAPINPQRPEQVVLGDNWIDVDLTKRILTLFAFNNEPLLTTYISPGREENPTRTGVYNVWYKLSKAEMKGGPPLHSYVYDLKNIPWVMFYNYDYAIHGTYWHDRFGTPQSAGCTNMTQGDAKFVFDHTKPLIPKGQEGVFSSDANRGTVVNNHD